MKLAGVGLLLLFAVVYLAPLGVRPLVVPDETRYGEIPREMIESGDWVVPRLAGLRYFEKPVMGYWVNALSIMTFGRNAFAVRFPSAAAAGLSALALFLVMRRFGGAQAGLLAAGVLLTMGLAFGIGVFAVLDSTLSAFVTGALTSFFAACMAERRGPRTLLLALCGVFCGMAFLTKGFLAFAVPVATIVPFLLWERRWKDMVTMPWVPLAGALAVSLPWCIMIHLHEKDFWHYFFWVEHIERFLTPTGAHHPEPFWFFVPVLLGGALPWTILLPAAAAGFARPGTAPRPLVRYLLCWLVFPFLGFSASGGKLGTYILPCMPALAGLIALGLLSYAKAGGRRLFVAASLLAAVVCLGTAAGLVVVQTTGILPALRHFRPGEGVKWILGAAALAACGALCLLAAVAGERRRLALFVAAPLPFMFILAFVIPRVAHEDKCPGKFLSARAHLVESNAVLVANEYLAGATCWFYNRSDVRVLEEKGELDYGLSDLYPDSTNRHFTVEALAHWIGDHPHGTVMLVTQPQRYADQRQILPAPTLVEEDYGFVLLRFDGLEKREQRQRELTPKGEPAAP